LSLGNLLKTEDTDGSQRTSAIY